jgi:ABC-type transport system involved in cytochrome c biogenesis ATPase subunit
MVMHFCALTAENIWILRDGLVINAPINLCLDQNASVCLLTGQNGAGKSSFLDCVLGLCDFDGQLHTSATCHYIGHNLGLPQHLYVKEIWPFCDHAAIANQIDHDPMNIAALWHKPIASLSRGQKQRVALACLFYQPNPSKQPVLWLMDEPESHLDTHYRHAFLHMIKQHQDHGGFALIATHMPEFYTPITKLQKFDIVNIDSIEMIEMAKEIRGNDKDTVQQTAEDTA